MQSEPSSQLVPIERVWKVRDVMTYTGLGRGSVYDLAQRGELPARWVGARWRFIPDEVRAWVDGQRRGAGATALPLDRERR